MREQMMGPRKEQLRAKHFPACAASQDNICRPCLTHHRNDGMKVADHSA